MIPELVVPDLEDCTLKPYVAYSTKARGSVPTEIRRHRKTKEVYIKMSFTWGFPEYVSLYVEQD